MRVLDASPSSERALHHLGPDMALPQRERLPATLEAARRTLQSHRPTTLDDSIYNHWLEALMALAKPQTAETLPKVLRTATWHDRQLEGLLGSWAELRHDTVLVVEQSTGGGGCQYAEGYVEPVPELYAALGRAATRLDRALPGSGSVEKQVRLYLAHFQTHVARLESMATTELAGKRLSRADLRFLNRAVDLHREEYGDRMYDGWYPTLYWTENWHPKPMGHVESGISKPVVADVHTDADAQKVLQVGVGNPALLIVALEVSGHTALYAGPVHSTYVFHQPITNRLSDNEWQSRVWGQKLPPHPDFAKAYWAE